MSVGAPRVKICCIASEAEAWTAIRHGAAALGLVAPMPSGPGTLPLDRIAEIARIVPPAVASFLLTPHRAAGPIFEQHRLCRTSTLQLCDRPEAGVVAALRAALPGVALVQVVHVMGEESIGEAGEAAKLVDALLLDSGNPDLAVKELGGTGRTHDWSVSRTIRERAGVPIFLAGGLNPGNVAQAVTQVRPFGVDVCSGVRTDGRLDVEKLGAFMRAVEGVR